MSPGFRREELAARYNVEQFSEDDWHAYTGAQTSRIISARIAKITVSAKVVLNAGSGVYSLSIPGWTEIALDLFEAPIRGRTCAVQGNIEALEFPNGTFGAVVCVGEVLGYCDPQKAIPEFARVLVPGGILICDFGSTRSFRNWFRKDYGRAADIVSVPYNGTPERVWVYDPKYLRSILVSSGFKIVRADGIHTWSALAGRVGLSDFQALLLQRFLGWCTVCKPWADIMTLSAVRI